MANGTRRTIKKAGLTPAALKVGTVGRIVAEIPRNTDFTVKFNPNLFQPLRPTKTVVVNQNPPPGDFVPTGTAVTVTVVEKSLIPPKSFTGLTPAVIDKFATIGALEDDLRVATDPVAVAAKAALDKGIAFDKLAAADQTAITTYAARRLPQGTDATKAANDIVFLYHL